MQVSDAPDERCRLEVLSALSVTLTEAWPRVPGHADDVMKALVRLLHDVSMQSDVTSSSTAAADLQRRALDCVQLLRNICPEYHDLTDDFFSQTAASQAN